MQESAEDEGGRRNRAGVESVLDRLSERLETARGRRVTAGEVIGAVGRRGFGPVFLALGLLVISPLGGIPAVPTLFAAIFATLAVQMLAGRRSLWVPSWLADRAVPGDRLAQAVGWLRPGARTMDRWFGRRFVSLTADTARRAAALCILALCLLVPLTEFVPFAALVPMSGIALFGLALTLRDGVVMAVAFTAAAGALIGAPMLLLSAA